MEQNQNFSNKGNGDVLNVGKKYRSLLKMLNKNKLEINNEGFTKIEIQIIEDQTRKQMQELDPLFLGDKYERIKR